MNSIDIAINYVVRVISDTKKPAEDIIKRAIDDMIRFQYSTKQMHEFLSKLENAFLTKNLVKKIEAQKGGEGILKVIKDLIEYIDTEGSSLTEESIYNKIEETIKN